MEFKIEPGIPTNRIHPDSLAEEVMLESDLLKTKLNYSVVSKFDNPQGTIINNSLFSYGENNGTPSVGIPNLTIDPRRAAYYIRMVLDANAVRNGFLPLHASAISDRKMTKFIFGETGKGKSLTLSRLIEGNPDFTPIGDDHILLCGGVMAGNSVMRTRYGNEETYQPLEIERVSPLEDYEIIIADVTGKDFSKELSPKNVIKDPIIKNAVLKYLISEPMEKESREVYHRLTSKLIATYRERFNNFVRAAKRIRELSGDKSYLEWEMKK